MTDRKLMQQALEALDFHFKDSDEVEEIDLALIAALRERLARHEHDLYTTVDKDKPKAICDRNGEVVLSMCKRCGKGEVELSEPCVPARQEQEQEPVAWRWIPSKVFNDYVVSDDPEKARSAASHGMNVQPLYTAPQPAQQPLTDEQIDEIVVRELGLDADADAMAGFARAIEAKLREKNA